MLVASCPARLLVTDVRRLPGGQGGSSCLPDVDYQIESRTVQALRLRHGDNLI